MPKIHGQPINGNFQGFSSETLTFLQELKANNNKEWFEDNRTRYKTVLLAPFQALARDLAAPMLEIDPNFEFLSLNKIISRIYRDIRFSKDKSPFRSNMWLTFKRQTKDWKPDPVFFFEILPDKYQYGLGFYSPTKYTMNALRARIDEHPEEIESFNALLAPNSGFELLGKEYKRLYAPTAAQLVTSLQPWYRKKDIYVMCTCPIEPIFFQAALVDKLAREFTSLQPLYDFFWEIRKEGDQLADEKWLE